jgi:hypothetical protein
MAISALAAEQNRAGVHMGTSEGALEVAIHRLRKRHRDLFRQGIAETHPSSDFWRLHRGVGR